MRLNIPIRLLLSSILLSVMIGHQASAQNLAEFEKKVTEFTLDNGLHFIIIERHEAPVASFYTHVNVGGADEPVGNTGIAHIFEHMAFKGTKYIGTTNWDEEKKVIAEMGGKNAIIVDNDAALDEAVQGTVVSAFVYAGQKCSACSRVISNSAAAFAVDL